MELIDIGRKALYNALRRSLISFSNNPNTNVSDSNVFNYFVTSRNKRSTTYEQTFQVNDVSIQQSKFVN